METVSNESGKQPTSSGLEGVVVAETRLSDVDGEAGRLILRGRAVEDIALTAAFEDACALFLDVTPAEAARRLREARARAAAEGGEAQQQGAGMDVLRRALAEPGREDPEGAWDAIALAVIALARSAGGPARAAQAAEATSHAAALLWALTGRAPAPAAVRALDTYLVTVIDHGMNASTFAARVVASTGSDLRSCLVAGVGALKGPLHGGAPGPVLDMLDAVAARPAVGAAAPPPARAWIDEQLDAKQRIMGMGHRIYRVRDPRAFVLERAVERLAREVDDQRVKERLALARVVEREAEAALAARHPERPLKANVEFFTAVLLEAVGIDRAWFSSVFACSRMVGWCAHVREQRQVGRLIRPQSRYVG